MARDFNGTTDRIDYTAPLVANGAQTFSCWANVGTVGHSNYLLTLHNDATPDTMALLFYVEWTDPNWQLGISITQDAGDWAFRQSNNDPGIINAQHHLLYTWSGANTQAGIKIYLDGSEVGYSEGGDGGGNLTAFNGPWSLGGRNFDNIRNLDGIMAATGFWNRVLGAGEISSLAAGYSPRFFPNGLQFAPDLVRSYFDPISGAAGTLDGTTVVPHPRIIYPSKIWVPHKAAAAAGTILPQITSAYMRI